MCYWTPGKYTSRALQGTQKQQGPANAFQSGVPVEEMEPIHKQICECQKTNANVNVNVR